MVDIDRKILAKILKEKFDEGINGIDMNMTMDELNELRYSQWLKVADFVLNKILE